MTITMPLRNLLRCRAWVFADYAPAAYGHHCRRIALPCAPLLMLPFAWLWCLWHPFGSFTCQLTQPRWRGGKPVPVRLFCRPKVGRY